MLVNTQQFWTSQPVMKCDLTSFKNNVERICRGDALVQNGATAITQMIKNWKIKPELGISNVLWHSHFQVPVGGTFANLSKPIGPYFMLNSMFIFPFISFVEWKVLFGKTTYQYVNNISSLHNRNIQYVQWIMSVATSMMFITRD